MLAALSGHVETAKWLLKEGGADITERCANDYTALLWATSNGQLTTAQWLLEGCGADISDVGKCGRNVWSMLKPDEADDDELDSLLKVMVLLDDAPADVIAKLAPRQVVTCQVGRQLRAWLPAYLEQQRAQVIAHCTLPAALRPIVAAYAATTPQDVWLYRLHVQAPVAKRAMEDKDSGEEGDEGVPRRRRSRRLHQKRG
jgi:hypothetical protein